MANHTGLIYDLKQRGIRVTPQRAIILKAIESLSGHITADDVFAEVQKINEFISLATVYRTLDLLKELGLILETNLGTGLIHYALKTHGHHHHAVCRSCDVIIDLPNELFASISATLAEEYAFTADANHLTIFGWCEHCTEKMKVES